MRRRQRDHSGKYEIGRQMQSQGAPRRQAIHNLLSGFALQVLENRFGGIEPIAMGNLQQRVGSGGVSR
jgi:hypothetical protein